MKTAAAPDAASVSTASPAASPDAHGRDMAEFCITYNGRNCAFRGYRYDHLAEAVDYARLDRARAFTDDRLADAIAYARGGESS